eukprot:PhM_4_TR18088/c0_g4_i4/m.106240
MAQSRNSGNHGDNALHCFVKAVEFDDSDAYSSWSSLGKLLIQQNNCDSIVSVRGTKFNAMDCCVKALQINPRIAEAWHNVGVAIAMEKTPRSVSIRGREYTSARSCFLTALELDPTLSSTWLALGKLLDPSNDQSVRINNLHYMYSALDCLVEALKHDKGSDGEFTYDVFNSLGKALLCSNTVVILGTKYTA